MKRFAVFGQPVAHSLSPRIHQAFAQQEGIAISYSKIESSPEHALADIREFFDGGGCGANLTSPFKEQAVALCDGLSPDARQAEAINTLYRGEDGSLQGANTDGLGFLRDLRASLDIDPGGRRVLILGAGGAVRGILGPLLGAAPAAVTIANRTLTRAQELAERFSGSVPVSALAAELLEEPAVPGEFDLIIQATSLGFSGRRLKISPSWAAAEAVGYDLAYSPAAGPFLAWCATCGIGAVDGLGMLVEQAALSFRLWCGVEPDTAPVKRLLAASV